MPAPRTRTATVSLLTAALLILGGAFAASGSDDGGTPFTTPVGAAAQSNVPSSHAVGVRHFTFARGKDRPLPTTVWYPVRGSARLTRGREQNDATPLPGQFPLILWSHGFYSNPQMQEGMTKFLAESGYIVAAPAYPFTKKDGPKFDKTDVPNQALDASFVISELMKPGSPLAASIDSDRLGAIGHSGGGTTTDWLFTGKRDPRLKVGVIFAGRPTGAYKGSPVPMLFVHGDKDPVVAYSQGRESYGKDPWPKAFLTIEGGEHGAGTNDPERGHVQVLATLLDFLDYAFNGDDVARMRLPSDATLPGFTHFESVGIYPESQPSATNSTTATTTTTATPTPTQSKDLDLAGSSR
ncbi:alpha/beta hydrolase [Dactylosporangium vinaceum]|uniref:Alpha/beta hydrolase n=1 Tax=Dactylosporangium vinaceum TaxID=53362 RepID=A0ABV5M683_9ACTN|nr:alpha/beta hydrolase [Dactylosporangium vinaceum]UAB97780.1 alpha/beta hydrolase [Dactylosporangium vinaceum]